MKCCPKLIHPLSVARMGATTQPLYYVSAVLSSFPVPVFLPAPYFPYLTNSFRIMLYRSAILFCGIIIPVMDSASVELTLWTIWLMLTPILFISSAMKRFVKCFFELLTQNFSARWETGRKRGVKRACGRLEAVFVGR